MPSITLVIVLLEVCKISKSYTYLPSSSCEVWSAVNCIDTTPEVASAATVGQSNSTTANIGVNTASGPQTVSVSLPSAQAAQNSSLQLKLLGDVDTTTLNDGAILQYRSSDGKFVTRNEIVTTTGTLTLNAGAF